MQDQDFNFGVTLDNGENVDTTESSRNLKKPNKSKKLKQQKNTDSSNSNINTQTQQSIPITGSYALSRANHPTVCLATIFFKSLAFVIYFFIGYFVSSVLTFIFTVILSSVDFWVIKNVSGRLLVGLRWWSDYDQKGNQVWKFQTHQGSFKVNGVDRSFFWASQVVGTTVWTFLLFVNILQLDLFWALLLAINSSLSITNLYGYYMCRGEHNKKIGKLKQQLGKAGLMQLGKLI